MESKITDIWKEKYSLSNVRNKISINPNDTLHSIYKKTAKYIYKNGLANSDFNKKTEYNAVFNRANHEYGEFKNLSINPINLDKLSDEENKLLGSSYGDITDYHFYQIEYEAKGQDRSRLVLVDPQNTTAKNDGVNYHWRDSLESGISKDGFVKYNQELLIGYDILRKDLVKNVDLNKAAESLIDSLNEKSLGAKKYTYLFEKSLRVEQSKNVIHEVTPAEVQQNDHLRLWLGFGTKKEEKLDNTEIEQALKKSPLLMGAENGLGSNYVWNKKAFYHQLDKNKAIDQIGKYLNQTYNLSLQTNFDQELNSNRATFFMTKKQINQSTEAKMKELADKWKDNVKGVELDNEVDLDKLDKLSPEIKSTLALLPKSENGEKPIIRFRKLKNHKALGIFTPFNNTLAVDFRPNDGGGIGLQSFVHEYGHFLDYNTQDGFPRSLSKDFQPILQKTQAEIAHISKDNENGTPKNKTYLSIPTEVFARGFEMYVTHLGLDNSLIKSQKQYNNSRYTTFAPEKSVQEPKLETKISEKDPAWKNDLKTKYDGKALSELPEREIRKRAYLITKGRYHSNQDKQILSLKAKFDRMHAARQLER